VKPQNVGTDWLQLFVRNGPVLAAPTLVLWFWEVIAMKATQGDRITIRGKTVESSDRHGQIIEVHGVDGAPPYVVRFDDGHETTVIPGGDFIVDRIQPPH
jgi:hypothetical protein